VCVSEKQRNRRQQEQGFEYPTLTKAGVLSILFHMRIGRGPIARKKADEIDDGIMYYLKN
jgi:hypothetical protein